LPSAAARLHFAPSRPRNPDPTAEPMPQLPSRDAALALMHQHVASESLRRHMYSVEAACRAYARRFGEDEELYGLAGLLHDFDYERFPDEHPLPGVEMLRERGYPDELIHAVQAHYAVRTGVQPVTRLDRTLRACDEITGLITAAALVRPSRSVMDLEAKSVLKKMKDRAFAAGVDREDVRHAADELGMELAEHVAFVIEAMRGVAPALGLAGPG
jgi:putative nucleotidyltransferase with HDIG domain